MKPIRTILSCWVVICLICLPFPFDWFPSIGTVISGFIFPITSFLSGYTGEFTNISDSEIYYVQCGLLLIVSSVAVIVLEQKYAHNRLSNIIHKVLVYALSFFLLKYGIVKLFTHQFYTIEPNIAFTPVGQLNKDILFWTSMGSSQSYNWFMGGIEVIGGLLLLSRRTRLIGTIMSTGITLNILAINIGFDITVKLLAALLFIGSLTALAHYKNRLLFLIPGSETEQIEDISLFTSRKLRILKGVVVCLFLFECLFPFVKSVPESSQLTGSYLVTSNTMSNKQFKNIKRVHFHSHNYLITESAEQEFNDHKYYFSALQTEININGASWNIESLENGNLQLSHKKSNENLFLKRIDNEKLPIMQDDIHLTFEQLLGD